jgi:hypothetical protein
VYRAPSAGRCGTPCRVKVRWLPRARARPSGCCTPPQVTPRIGSSALCVSGPPGWALPHLRFSAHPIRVDAPRSQPAVHDVLAFPFVVCCSWNQHHVRAHCSCHTCVCHVYVLAWHRQGCGREGHPRSRGRVNCKRSGCARCPGRVVLRGRYRVWGGVALRAVCASLRTWNSRTPSHPAL